MRNGKVLELQSFHTAQGIAVGENTQKGVYRLTISRQVGWRRQAKRRCLLWK